MAMCGASVVLFSVATCQTLTTFTMNPAANITDREKGKKVLVIYPTNSLIT